MEVSVKTFGELEKEELYQVLQLRAAIFVVEQECAYQDLDGKDRKALHVLGKENGDVVAYTRVFGPGDYFDDASIGRVAVRSDFRGKGLGLEIMEASLEVVRGRYAGVTITLSAQQYLEKFYKDLGFRSIGETYLEDGIPHIRMVKDPEN
ncbi:GNAT family N-acetyltransferase [Robiginitalea marina]|uniref:GNAT family N-acetyltransferase n=1 Tax=Robiginitalea marina TaxID=2954105 RepID=A0ABT1AW00_9FLAO|nr:GNAT family N-acetyltransferase [Robiginitalea marina]MCO5724187.1 GNAT family N-acetyltransferase [Robiginitalea marina]